jgi:type IV pilus assembly protein PilM
MALRNKLTELITDPPPAYLFELSEAGIAYTVLEKGAPAASVQFRPLDAGVLSVSPLHDNVQQPEILAAQVAGLVPANGARKRRRAALILPDYAARIAVLDFDAFPTDPADQLSLVRFRIKKSIPFDIESATVSYHVQRGHGRTKIEVVAAVIALEIVARYEAPFRAANYVPGFVTTSALAALNLVQAEGIAVLAKLSGQALSVMVLDGPALRLARCVELEEASNEEMLAVLYPTLAYIEDELNSRASRLLLCGFGDASALAAEWQPELGVAIEPVHSRIGAAGPYNSGLLGYLETAA